MLPRRVLVIDDERMIRLTISILLRKKGIEVVVAESSAEGVVLAESESPDAILLDVMMPGMDGWTVLAKLKANAATASIPVFMFSAGEYAETELRARDKGVAGIIRKPFRVEELLATIDLPEKPGPG
jgi:DNA-binding response OmpR family regulator